MSLGLSNAALIIRDIGAKDPEFIMRWLDAFNRTELKFENPFLRAINNEKFRRIDGNRKSNFIKLYNAYAEIDGFNENYVNDQEAAIYNKELYKLSNDFFTKAVALDIDQAAELALNKKGKPEDYLLLRRALSVGGNTLKDYISRGLEQKGVTRKAYNASQIVSDIKKSFYGKEEAAQVIAAGKELAKQGYKGIEK